MYNETDDQAKVLRERLDESIREVTTEDDKLLYEKDEDDMPEVDVLTLPPRGAIHEEKKQSVRLKVSFAMIRLLVIVFILLVVFILTYPYWKDTFFSDSNGNVLDANTIDRAYSDDDERFMLSNEITRTVTQSTGEKVAVDGRFYITLEGETLTQIIDRFYQTKSKLNDIQAANGIVNPYEILPVGTKIFLIELD